FKKPIIYFYLILFFNMIENNEGDGNLVGVYDILKKPKYDRSASDLHYLFVKLKNFFFVKQTLRKFGREIVFSIFNCLVYSEFQAKKNLFNYDDEGYECYVLLEGEIDVLAPNPKFECLAKKYWQFEKVGV